MTEPELDLESRELCGDDTCIGLLGEDGRCRECRRTPTEALAGELPSAVLGGAPSRIEGEPALDEDPEWAQRELCPEETCIGVLAEDGRCGECGRVTPRRAE